MYAWNDLCHLSGSYSTHLQLPSQQPENLAQQEKEQRKTAPDPEASRQSCSISFTIFYKKVPVRQYGQFLPYHLREFLYYSALRIFPSSRLANTIASANAAASAIGPAYITPSIP